MFKVYGWHMYVTAKAKLSRGRFMSVFSFIVGCIEAGIIKDKYKFRKKPKGLTIALIVANIVTTPFATIPALIALSVTGIMDVIVDAIWGGIPVDESNSGTKTNVPNPRNTNYYQNHLNNRGQFTPNQTPPSYYNSFGPASSVGNRNGNVNYRPSTTKPNGKISNPYNLPGSEKKRAVLVDKFNKKYDLNLTSNDIQTMSSATYMSIEWASEVYAMTQKYDSIYEWLGQGNIWLRVYLYAFNVQNISPVFNKQEELVFNSFNTIFNEMCVDESLPTEVIIENINNKYMTRFDEATFLLAINYMESKGIHFKFGAPILTRVSSDIEDLEKKYQRMQ